ncbi:hypothetical protein [Limobrevibacterium gyesilva]|uniref:Uncharacterized protein n=1 Tax=Limobrevibacterium gyesilva TaxID=2991712 RepID=A0AA41YRJ1_9PROT|nr:hypothetical protein [Limobrevibacterium gyesilva]MCW3477401.1 hypothetical protein [Limobrevibacterium gyesilva]
MAFPSVAGPATDLLYREARPARVVFVRGRGRPALLLGHWTDVRGRPIWADVVTGSTFVNPDDVAEIEDSQHADHV